MKAILIARVSTEEQKEAGQSSLLKQLTESTGDLVFGEARPVQPKGISGTIDVHHVDWGAV